MKLNNVLVVGAQGFIGSRLVKRHQDWYDIDLKNGEDFTLEGYFNDYDAIIMLAAKHLDFTLEDYAYNIRLYEALARTVVDSRKFPFVLFISSAAVYTPTTDVSHKENDVLRPATLYGKSKVVGEQIVQDVCSNYTILRLSNVFGDGDGHGAIDRFKNGSKTIFGDGEQVRDYIHVDRVVTAIERVMDAPVRYSRRVYNISNNVGRTTKGVFHEYGHGEPEFVGARPEDVSFSILDNSKALKDGLL